MAKKDRYGIPDMDKEFPNDDACLDYLFDILHNRTCSCGGSYARITGRKKFQCSKCRFQIAPMVGTIFQKSSTPLRLWFRAILCFSNAKSGISAKQMQRELNVTYKCAYRILKLIRKSVAQETHRLRGNVEMDDGFFGGKGGGGKYNENYSEVMKKKSKVIAAIERGGEMRAKKVADLSAPTIQRFLEENIQPEGTRLMTDESNHYHNVMLAYNRKTVNHSKKQFVRGDVHVNSVEWFWGHVKKSIRGTYKSISKEQLQSYLDAFVWHYNNRGNDRLRFASLLAAIVR